MKKWACLAFLLLSSLYVAVQVYQTWAISYNANFNDFGSAIAVTQRLEQA